MIGMQRKEVLNQHWPYDYKIGLKAIKYLEANLGSDKKK